MARNAGPLNAKRIAKLKPGRYSDPDSKGLYLQVGSTGTKSWLFRFWLNKRPERSMGLGAYPDFSLKEARERARAARQLLTDGIDPIEAKATARDAKRAEAVNNITFKQAAKAYIAAHADGWRNAKHRQQWSNTLASYAYPALGERLVSGIDAAAINDAVAPIWQRIPDSAARTKGRIERVVEWVKSGKLLPKPAAAKRKPQPALPYERLPEFMADLRERSGISPRALEFLIQTATRTGAVIGATWDEIDFDKRMWTIPGSRDGTKIKDPNDDHRVPLASEAIELLRSLPREQGNAHVFVGGRKGKPLSDMALNETVKQMNSERQRAGLPMYVDPKQNNRPIVPHGFRSSFRDWAAERTNYPNHVVEMAMAHVIGNKVEAAYRRGDLLQKRVRLMSDWARYCTTKPGKVGEVVPLRAAR